MKAANSFKDLHIDIGNDNMIGESMEFSIVGFRSINFEYIFSFIFRIISLFFSNSILCYCRQQMLQKCCILYFEADLY